MGVINLTPNSFSDGGRAFRYSWWQDPFDIFDVGAESTAPFNKSISFDEEQSRLEEYLYPHLEKLRGKTLSLDSYKLKTMKTFLDKFSGLKIILNDVSGKLESEYLDLLKNYPNVNFVLSHNLAPNREETSNHMKYTQEAMPDLKLYFQEKLNLLEKHQLQDRVILDPCFGFSKTIKQNEKLLKQLPDLIKSFASDIPWLIGISRKTFLRDDPKMDLKNIENQIKLDNLQAIILTRLMDALPKHKLIMRVHTAESFNQALKVHQKF